MSSIPTVLDALIARIGFLLPDAQVSDGPAVQWLNEDTIVIGWSPDRSGITVDIDREGLGGDQRERYDVACVISSVSGNTDIKPLRDRAFALYATIASDLKRHPTLNGVALSVRPSVADLDQAQTSDGAEVTLFWTATCDAYA